MKRDASKWDGKTVVMRKIADLRPAEYNPRQLSKKQFADIKASLTRYGFVEPVVINAHPTRRDTIIGGHQRVKVAQEMGIAEVPCVTVALDEKRERELNVRLNRNQGEWSWDCLANQFDVADLVEWGFELEDFGIEKLGTEAEPEDKPRCKCPLCGNEHAQNRIDSTQGKA